MKNKELAIAIAAVVVVAAAIYFLWQSGSQVSQKQAVQSLEQSLDEVVGAPEVNVPSANPGAQAVPGVNPIKKTNPFSNVYQNPFK